MLRSRDVLTGVAGAVAVVAVVGAGAYATTSWGERSTREARTSAEAAVTTAEPTPTPTPVASTAPSAAPTVSAVRVPAAAPAKPRVLAARPTVKPTPRARPMMARGSSGRSVRELQARLTQIGWFFADPSGHYGRVTESAVAGFQRKRGLPDTGEVDRTTWSRLLRMTSEPSSAALYARPVPKTSSTGSAVRLDARCRTGRALCIDKSSRRLRWVVDGQIVSSMDVRFGSQFTPTREGTFSVYFKNRDHVSRLYDTAMPYAMFFSGGQAVHYSADFAARGYSGASHGCVNVRDRGAVRALFDSVRLGDKVVVYRA